VIKSFRHKGIESFFKDGSKAGIQPKHAEKLRNQLFALDNAKRAQDMSAPGWRLHRLRGGLAGPLVGRRKWQLASDIRL